MTIVRRVNGQLPVNGDLQLKPKAYGMIRKTLSTTYGTQYSIIEYDDLEGNNQGITLSQDKQTITLPPNKLFRVTAHFMVTFNNDSGYLSIGACSDKDISKLVTHHRAVMSSLTSTYKESGSGTLDFVVDSNRFSNINIIISAISNDTTAEFRINANNIVIHEL